MSLDQTGTPAMKWFNGSMLEAIVEAHSRRALVMVFFESEDPPSKNMRETFEDPEVNSLLQVLRCVPIRICASSAACFQFTLLHPVTAIPSTFFINSRGMLQMSVVGFVDPATFRSHLESIVASSGINVDPGPRVANDDIDVPADWIVKLTRRHPNDSVEPTPTLDATGPQMTAVISLGGKRGNKGGKKKERGEADLLTRFPAGTHQATHINLDGKHSIDIMPRNLADSAEAAEGSASVALTSANIRGEVTAKYVSLSYADDPPREMFPSVGTSPWFGKQDPETESTSTFSERGSSCNSAGDHDNGDTCGTDASLEVADSVGPVGPSQESLLPVPSDESSSRPAQDPLVSLLSEEPRLPLSLEDPLLSLQSRKPRLPLSLDEPLSSLPSEEPRLPISLYESLLSLPSDEPRLVLPLEQSPLTLPSPEPRLPLSLDEPLLSLSSEEPRLVLPLEQPPLSLPSQEPRLPLSFDEPLLSLPSRKPRLPLPLEQPLLSLPSQERRLRLPPEEPLLPLPPQESRLAYLPEEPPLSLLSQEPLLPLRPPQPLLPSAVPGSAQKLFSVRDHVRAVAHLLPFEHMERTLEDVLDSSAVLTKLLELAHDPAERLHGNIISGESESSNEFSELSKALVNEPQKLLSPEATSSFSDEKLADVTTTPAGKPPSAALSKRNQTKDDVAKRPCQLENLLVNAGDSRGMMRPRRDETISPRNQGTRTKPNVPAQQKQQYHTNDEANKEFSPGMDKHKINPQRNGVDDSKRIEQNVSSAPRRDQAVDAVLDQVTKKMTKAKESLQAGASSKNSAVTAKKSELNAVMRIAKADVEAALEAVETKLAKETDILSCSAIETIVEEFYQVSSRHTTPPTHIVDKRECEEEYINSTDDSKRISQAKSKEQISLQSWNQSPAKADIVLKFPDGTSALESFPADTYLDEVRWRTEELLAGNLPTCFPFTMARTNPPREFLHEDYRRTLEQLNLTPSAILLILPRNTASRMGRAAATGTACSGPNCALLATLMFGVLVASPIAFLWSMLSRPRTPTPASTLDSEFAPAPQDPSSAPEDPSSAEDMESGSEHDPLLEVGSDWEEGSVNPDIAMSGSGDASSGDCA